MVGHTHEDVDQLFSRISSGLAKRDAHTLPQLLEAIEKSATPKPATHHLRSMYDYRGKLIKSMGLVDGIMAPHHFKFEMVNGEVIMSYKDWPDEREEYRTLNIDRHIIPLGSVSPVPVNDKIDPQLAKMEQDLQKWADSGRLEDGEVRWWRTYLGSCKSGTKQVPNVSKITSLGKFKIPRVFEEEDSEISNLVQAVHRSKEKENRRSVLKLRR